MKDEILTEIRNLLKDLCTTNNNLPKMIYAKEIADNYSINRNRATEFCQKYGTNFGGWCVESTRFQEILHNADGNLFN